MKTEKPALQAKGEIIYETNAVPGSVSFSSGWHK